MRTVIYLSCFSKAQCCVQEQVCSRVQRCEKMSLSPRRVRQVPVGQQSRDIMTRVAQSSPRPGHRRRYADLFGCLSQIISGPTITGEGVAAGHDHGISLSQVQHLGPQRREDQVGVPCAECDSGV